MNAPTHCPICGGIVAFTMHDYYGQHWICTYCGYKDTDVRTEDSSTMNVDTVLPMPEKLTHFESDSEVIFLRSEVERLKKRVKELETDRWIPVTDSLPNQNEVIMILERKEETFKARYDPEWNGFAPWRLIFPGDEHKHEVFGRRNEHVTHWRRIIPDA